MTTPAVVDSGGFAPAAGAVVLTLKKGAPAAGLLMMAFIGYNDTSWPGGPAGPVMPTGWLKYGDEDKSGANDALGIFYKWSVAGDPASYTFGTGGDINSGVILSFTGIATATPFSVVALAGGPNGASSIASPAVTPLVNGSLVIAAYSDDTGPVISTETNGWVLYSETGTYHGCGVAVRTAVTSDSSPQSCTFASNNNFGAYTVATMLLAPASAGTTTDTVTVKVTDSVTTQAATGMGSFTVSGGTTPPPPPLAVTTVNIASGALNTAYTATLAASGGVPAYTWSVAAGSALPPGLSLSAAGVLSGTPTTSGTWTFTVEVQDTKGVFATAPLGMTVSGAAIATLVYPPGQRYTFTAQNPRLSIKGESVLPYVDLNVWGPTSDETMTGKVYTANNWTVNAKMTNPGGSVTCFPNTGAYPTSAPWQAGALSYLISGWDETMDTNTDIIASACYDNWFDNTLVGPTGSAINEVMFHYDFRNRGAGPWRATKVPFGGYTVNGVAIPLTFWNLAAIGTAAYWNLVDASGNITNLAKGSVDALAMFQWLVTNGYLSTTCKLTGFSAGFEICSTNGSPRNFTYNDLWWSGA